MGHCESYPALEPLVIEHVTVQLLPLWNPSPTTYFLESTLREYSKGSLRLWPNLCPCLGVLAWSPQKHGHMFTVTCSGKSSRYTLTTFLKLSLEVPKICLSASDPEDPKRWGEISFFPLAP